MTPPRHSFGPACAFRDEHLETSATQDDEPVPVKAQFFYISLLPIDDPLSPVPAVQAEKLANVAPQPFSIRDNAALEAAWQKLRRQEGESNNCYRPESRGLARMTSFPAFRSGLKSPEQYSPTTESSTYPNLASTNAGQYNGTALQSHDIDEEDSQIKSGKKPSPKFPRRSSIRSTSSRSRNPSQTTQEDQCIPHTLEESNKPKPIPLDGISSPEQIGPGNKRTQTSPLRHRQRRDPSSPESSISANATSDLPNESRTNSGPVTNGGGSDISGRPFARAPSSRQFVPGSTATVKREESPHNSSPHDRTKRDLQDFNPGTAQIDFVPVGVSRLHLVQLSEMQMKPIYWSPVNDISNVIRATWFYKDTMLPVPADVANRLEKGYEDMRPYNTTYQDELNACIEHGAAAELKIVYKLWPEDQNTTPPLSSAGDQKADSDADISFAVEPRLSTNAAADPRRSKTNKKLFESYSVIYLNSRNAQILRPNALPSISRNRTPLNSIRKGRNLGVAVVRGFDRNAWQKLHPDPKHDAAVMQARMGALMARPGTDITSNPSTDCPRCDQDDSTSKVSDLVLVIHGIGQKLSERVDSYHFTHAINELRREFNVEMANESVRGTIGDDKGMMVLPVNWRLTVTFDEGQQSLENQYGLNDITPDSLPAVRSLISDVMLDIPYFMSHHKSKMTSAVIREANRVYRLWCRNNPGFEKTGRVHVVAHSLGSVMAMEILSNQPTFVCDDLELSVDSPSENHFEFNTTNLFCCGSPSGFFLLLNDANLVPRRGRNKPGMEGEDLTRGIADEQGKYGCLAVDNIYNICHRNDPIAYCQNACVDKSYAASLQPASVPSATQSLFGRIGNSLRWASSSAHDAYGFVPTVTRPPMAQMPSTVELETHNFTREEIAEKRMFLLNENGQIDYFLSSGGGPLEIQYLNMLGAHSSYWILQDFCRFLVVEIGRAPGKDNTLPALRAVKKRQYQRATLA